MVNPKRNSYGEIIFKDYPEFKPNISPREMFVKGSFGGTYWRPIQSSITSKKYKNMHLKYPKSWWKGIEDKYLTSKEYNRKFNYYGVKVGSDLHTWENKGWITQYHPYGWVQWYCDFYKGKRGPDDARQIKRWMGVASDKGRFRKWLMKLIMKKSRKYNDNSISPKIRQTLLHWGYELTKRDFDKFHSM
jgi:hypothetical protein